MNIWITYLIIAAALIVAELLYFKLADLKRYLYNDVCLSNAIQN